MIIVICIVGLAILSWVMSTMTNTGQTGFSGVVALGYFAMMLLVAMGTAFYQQWQDRKNHRDD